MSKVTVANQALVEHLGQDPIVGFDDGTTESKAVNTLYENIRKEVIREHPWKCIQTRVNLTFASPTPAFLYSRGYPLPADFMRIVDVYEGEIALKSGWKKENGRILITSDGPLQLVYVFDSEDTNEWDSLLTSCVSARLALALAPKLNPDKKDTVAGMWKELQSQAKRVNAQDGNSISPSIDSWVAARFGSHDRFRDISEP